MLGSFILTYILFFCVVFIVVSKIVRHFRQIRLEKNADEILREINKKKKGY